MPIPIPISIPIVAFRVYICENGLWKRLMRINCIELSGIAVILLFALQLPAQDLREPRFMERAQAGFAHIYNLDYVDARQVFDSLEKEYPQHPAPPLYLACILWLEEMLRRQDLSLNRFLYASYFSGRTDQVMPPRERDAFFKNLRKCESWQTRSY
jgi:hypothetical protein